ncbi:MAG: hypothetical protein CL698_00495, partial [Chloroflexi bacterium]|nr:hypothetical protein [Chloroflexota bacterium]
LRLAVKRIIAINIPHIQALERLKITAMPIMGRKKAMQNMIPKPSFGIKLLIRHRNYQLI